MPKSNWCRVGIHKWVVRREPDIPPYVACAKCDKTKLVDTRPEHIAGATRSEYPDNPEYGRRSS